MKKRSVLCIILVFLMLSSFILSSCKGSENDKNDTSANDSTTENDSTETDIVKSNLPEELDFGGDTFTVLYWDDAEFSEFDVEKATGAIVDDAIYDRNSKVEQYLNIELAWLGKPGNTANIENFAKYVETTNSIGDNNEYDIIATYSRTAGKLATDGQLLDMLNTTYADFDMPWWPEFVIDQAMINNKLYFVTGDISTNMLYQMTTMFYNKELVDDDMYSIVNNGEWTIEKLIELTTNTYIDKNGDTLKDVNDSYGFISYAPFINAFFLGSGISFISKDTDGVLVVDPSYGGEKTQSILEKINALYHAKNDWYYMGSGTTNGKNMHTVFAEGRSLFIMEAVALPQKKLLEYEGLRYGVLPLPKYDSTQNNYRTLLNNPITLYSVPTMVDVERSEEVSAVIECMAYNAYLHTTPAVFENLFKARFADSNNDALMFDLIRDNSVLELGQVFNASLEKIPGDALYTHVQDNKIGWIVYFESVKTVLSNSLKKVNAAFGNIS